jgi:hypothetical protein
LPKLVAEREDLEGQVAQWEEKVAEVTSSFNKSEARFPKSVESIEYDETLFKIADDCDLQVVELTALEPKNEKVKDTDIIYTTTTLEVKVWSKESPPGTVGEFETYIDETVANMLKFINAIATGEEFNVGTIELVAMENLEPPEEEDLAAAEDEAARWDMAPAATVQLIIYGFPR